jgi:plasmid stabilization system protein ParE
MRIRWTDPAVQDFTNICDYIEQHASSETARRLAITIYTAIGTLDRWVDILRVLHGAQQWP